MRTATVAVVGTLLTLANAQVADICIDSCGLTDLNQGYSRYSVSASVSSNKPDEDFPRKGDGNDAWQAYAISAATATIIMLVLCCFACCCCCCYVCRMGKRLDKDIACCCGVPGAPSEVWATSNTMKMAAWILLAGCGTAWVILTIMSYAYNTELSDSVRDVPNVLFRFANFLENNVGGDIECVLGRAETVSNEAIALLDDPNIQTNATASSLVNDIIAAVVDFENPLNGTTDGVLAAINDGADSIRDAASSASDWTNEAGDQMEVFIYTCLTVVLIVGLINVVLAGCVAKGEASRGNCYGWLTFTSMGMILMMFLALLIAAIVMFVLRFEAGWCDAPFEITSSYIATDNPSDPVTYYLECSEFSDSELETHWPWASEQQQLVEAFTNISTYLDQLEGSGADISGLQNATDQLGCTVTADFGLLGYKGALSCANMQSFVQDVVIQVCTRMYDPLYALVVCFIILGVLIMFTIWIMQAVRREENWDHRETRPSISVSPVVQNSVIRRESDVYHNNAFDQGQDNYDDKGKLSPNYSDPPPYTDDEGGYNGGSHREPSDELKM